MTNLSPAVIAREFSNAPVVEEQGSSTGALVGLFEWGPAMSPQLVNNAVRLVDVFGLPTDANFVDHMCATNFLSYTNRLFVNRVTFDNATNSGLTVEDAGTGIVPHSREDYLTQGTGPELILNEDDFNASAATLETSAPTVLFYGRYAGAYGNRIEVAMTSSGSIIEASINNSFDRNIEANEYGLVVYLDGDIVETHIGNANPSAKSSTGGSDYIVEIVNRTSRFVYMSELDLLFADPDTFVPAVLPKSALVGGDDGANTASEESARIAGWNMFNDPETTEIDLPFAGGASQVVSEHMVENVSLRRADCLGFISPRFEDVVNITNPSTVVSNLVTYRNMFNSNSYAFLDGGYKYQYDIYNDKYRWVPYNGDMAGLHARTDTTNDPWFAAGGFNRGHVKNVTRVTFNPDKAFRDELYKNGINPIVEFPGEGVVLFGNRTLEAGSGPTSRANIRRLLNVLKRSISKAALKRLFEFNDRRSRNEFIQTNEPFLRSVQARRGVQRYQIVCDETNNTDQVINARQFVGDIYIQPSEAVETIFLNFISGQAGIEFEEITFSGVDA